MQKYPAPLPHDTEAEDKEFRAAFADAMRKASPISPPAQKPAPELGGSSAALVGNLQSCRFAVGGNYCGNCDRDLSDCWSAS